MDSFGTEILDPSLPSFFGNLTAGAVAILLTNLIIFLTTLVNVWLVQKAKKTIPNTVIDHAETVATDLANHISETSGETAIQTGKHEKE